MTCRPRDKQAGYTLLEAMVALAVASLALSALLMVGMRGVATGFRLGARAASHADEQVSLQALRDTLEAIVLPPIAVATSAAAVGSGTTAGTGSADSGCDGVCDDTFEGEAFELVGHIIPMRETACVPLSEHARLRLTITSENGRTQITCRIEDAGEQRGIGGDGETPTLANLSWADARFSYSEDGAQWFDEWTVTRGETVDRAATPDAELRKVYVRVANAAGTQQVIALVTSGRALAQGGRRG